mmetsp:Transcript_36375/g.74651  ORF Transcript_36375/g.74651 Transcript_36375/m.74651 type:complete len:144 (-) Transcript_36375:268-699(-)|eukprot:CAMPEP_0181325298 /NCGR_PEP_ID=MMETSP1101-20121128/20843_1 /TAXON_ID=46948 /ORGANISM="Rhodomonas abbreviata, Strain Caron Lab Isolate" /LENGTH=143 /DNA_ID=CAMNT_0023433581 /DNA_START=168 /DNA_END=599 /DNA_ORIENTATION=-
MSFRTLLVVLFFCALLAPGQSGYTGSQSSAEKWEQAGRKAYVNSVNSKGGDIVDMGGTGEPSKMAAMRMWFDGKSMPVSPSEPEPAGESFLGDLPYVLPIVGACVLCMVIVGVRMLKNHQPRQTSYFSPSYSKEVMKGQKPRQ